MDLSSGIACAYYNTYRVVHSGEIRKSVNLYMFIDAKSAKGFFLCPTVADIVLSASLQGDIYERII